MDNDLFNSEYGSILCEGFVNPQQYISNIIKINRVTISAITDMLDDYN